ncbi:MAG: hypothetical protein JKY03_06795 [Aureispira sp.]|nr:hypothetical protein [Aureispira sp.]
MKQVLLILIFATLLLSCNSDSVDSAPEIKEPTRTKVSKDVKESAASIIPLVPKTIPPFYSKKGDFSIVFPGTPKEHKHTTTSEIGKIELTQYIYGKNDTDAWVASFSDYPKRMIQLGNKTQLLKGIKYRILKDLRATVLFEEKIELDDKYNGLSFVAKAKKKDLNITYKIFLVKNRVYQLSMYSSIGAIQTQDSIDFFGSFKLVSKEEKKEPR